MQKKWAVTGLLASGAIGLWWLDKQKKEEGLSFRHVEKQMEKSGYSVFRTPEKGVYLLVKNHMRSLLIYDNPKQAKRSLFNRLNDHEHGYDHELFLVSDSPNSLYAKTKTLFFRWYHTQQQPKKPLVVHFSTLTTFLNSEETTWESTIL